MNDEEEEKVVFPLQQSEVIMREREGGKYNLRKGRAANKYKYKYKYKL